MHKEPWRETKIIWLLFLLAFALRLASRIRTGEADFLANSYFFFHQIAANFLNGGGLCVSPGVACAMRVPVYPLFVVPFVASGHFFFGLAVIQSVIGAALCFVAARIGEDLFDRRTGQLAAVMVAFNPYAVIHDTALQETALFNLLIALATMILVRVSSWRGRHAIAAGTMLALATLTTARIALFIPCAALCVVAAHDTGGLTRIRRFCLFSLPLVILLGGWMFRNWRVIGAPVLSAEAGLCLWDANNDWTFSYFPTQSIDLSKGEAYRHLSEEQLAELGRQDGEAGRDRLYLRWGLDYIVLHPGKIMNYGVRKIWVAVSGQLSPARDERRQIVFGLVFGSIHLLAAFALWHSRRNWTTQLPIYAFLISFLITTGIFWAHTSHKSYIDAVLFVYAAAALTLFFKRFNLKTA